MKLSLDQSDIQSLKAIAPALPDALKGLLDGAAIVGQLSYKKLFPALAGRPAVMVEVDVVINP